MKHKHKRENPHYRDMDYWMYREDRITDKFRELVEQRVLPHIHFAGYKLAEKKRIATHAIHKLIKTGLRHKVVADTRNARLPGVKFRVKVWDAIVQAGFATVCIGSDSSGELTRYRATKKLKDIRREWKLPVLEDTEPERNTENNIPLEHGLIIVRAGRFDPVTGARNDDRKQLIPLAECAARFAQPLPDGTPDPAAIRNGLARVRAIEDLLEQINRANLRRNWQTYIKNPETGRLHICPVNPCLKQIHIGKLGLGTRLYTYGELGGQSFSKEVRARIEIDGARTAGLDFSGMVPRMAYHTNGVDFSGNVYQPERIFPKFWKFRNVTPAKKAIVRNFLKRATNVCLNVNSRLRAERAVANQLRQSKDHDFLQNVLGTIENASPKAIVGRIIRHHQPIQGNFFTEEGLKLMAIDGQIMLHILNELVLGELMPILGIHDGLVCLATDADLVKEIMEQTYRQFLNFSPVVKREF